MHSPELKRRVALPGSVRNTEGGAYEVSNTPLIISN